ncbi:MAG TPA: sigma 54-interacting transcriptional regulator [Terriglobales bacterium]|nr:sigma 54-interacting transcriptional regulator [Terriglobales bacterium]
MTPAVREHRLAASVEPSRYVPSRSPAMARVEQLLVRLAEPELPLLLLGEEGCGKRALAKFVHDSSPRRDQPFVVMKAGQATVAALGEGMASPCTLYVQAIQELSAPCQSTLLEACANGNGNGARTARLIAGAVQDPEFAVRCGHFREDLFYRLSGITSRVPPLRHRKEDIPALADFFLGKYASECGLAKPGLSRELCHFLVEHTWIGNVTELQLVTKAIMALGDEAEALVGLHSLLSGNSETKSGAPLSLKQAARQASRQAERELILEVLARTRWNRKRAAEELQISYKALLYKLKEIGVQEQGSESLSGR